MGFIHIKIFKKTTQDTYIKYEELINSENLNVKAGPFIHSVNIIFLSMKEKDNYEINEKGDQIKITLELKVGEAIIPQISIIIL